MSQGRDKNEGRGDFASAIRCISSRVARGTEGTKAKGATGEYNKMIDKRLPRLNRSAVSDKGALFCNGGRQCRGMPPSRTGALTMSVTKVFLTYLLCLSIACLSSISVAYTEAADQPKDLAIVNEWRGDYPVSALCGLPEGQRSARIGYVNTLPQFTDLWKAFKPGEKVPEVDFSKHLVVFARNVTFYNRNAIAKVLLKDNVVEILVRETMSAFPIEDRVAMSIAVIPRAGIDYIEAGTERIPVKATAHRLASDPLNAAYSIEGQLIMLHNGHSEIAISPDSAIKIRTSIIGNPVAGDLDEDGDDDAVIFLVHDPGGSGNFYYAAAALNVKGRYQGTNVVLLGDRIAPGGITIRNGVIEVNYTDRKSGEPMSSDPSIEKQIYFILDNGNLRALNAAGKGEELFHGWVKIGHEVRTFWPCSLKSGHWLSGDSPALGEIMAQYRKALPQARPYKPLFMALAGKIVEPPREGFGADYEASFHATQLVSVRPKGNCRSDFIYVNSPAPGETLSSPLTVKGKARGTWFFEGDFPVFLEDMKGNVISRGFVTAKGEWMTKEFVPFEGTLKFEKPAHGDSGTLIFRKANPTDRRELDDEIHIPVFFP